MTCRCALVLPVLALAALTGAPATSAGADGAADPVPMKVRAQRSLADLSTRVTQGWVDNSLTFSQLEARLLQGERLRVGCGIVSTLAIRRMLRMGIPARLVAMVSLDRTIPADESFGHTFMEVRLGGRWQVYDLTFNRKPLDVTGNGLSAARMIRLVRRNERLRFEVLSRDPEIDYSGFPADFSEEKYREVWKGGVRSFYTRYMQKLLVWTSSGWTFTAEPQTRSYVESLSPAYRWVPEATFSAIMTSSSADFAPLSW